MALLGNWDALSNIPFIIDGIGTPEDTYEVVVPGNRSLGSTVLSFNVGDFVALDGMLIWTLIPSGGGGGGGVSSVSISTANGFSGSVTNPTSTPNISISTTVNGILKGNGTVVSAASNSDITSKLLTGYVSGAGVVAPTDSILSAIQKLNGNIAALAGGITFKGVWNANTNTPTLVSGGGTTGDLYEVNVAGTTNLDGISSWSVGDFAIFDGVAWQKIPGSAPSVISVNGMTGAVPLTGTSGQITISGSNVFAIDSTYVGQSSITTLGTISTGVWNGSAIPILYGGTGQTTTNAALNALVPSQTGNAGKILKTDGTNTSWTGVGSGTVSLVGIDSTLVGGPIVTTGTLGLNLSNANTWLSNQTGTAWITSGGISSQFVKGDGSLDSTTYLSTIPTLNQVLGAANTSATSMIIVSGGNNSTVATTSVSTTNGSTTTSIDPTKLLFHQATYQGAIVSATLFSNQVWTMPNNTGTVALTSDIPAGSPSALTKTDDTNVTLTLGGTPTTALLQATSLTLGWTGTLADGRIASAATWNAKQPAGSYITALTSDVTASGPGSATATIAANAVTYAKMQAISTTSKLLGSSSTTTPIQEISIGTGLSLSGTTLTASGSGGTVTSVSGTSNRITSTGGTTPVIDISATFEALLGKVASPLSQFAATTSSQLAGVISDETGTGALVFSNTPTLVTAVLGSSTATTQSPADNSTKVATTAYVDNAVLGQRQKEAVKYASTAVLPSIVYANGSSGVGATLTGVALAAISLDSSSPSVNDRVLIKNQASTFQNGIYVVTATGSGVAVFVLTRTTDFDQSSDIQTGDTVFITSGSTLASTTWTYNAGDNPAIGTDPITFVQAAGPGSYTQGNGITITGTSIAIDTSVTVDKTTSQTLTNKTLTSPTLTTPALGTPASGNLSNCTNITPTSYTGLIETIAFEDSTTGITAQTYTLDLYANYGYTINSLNIISGSGTCTAAVQIGGSNVTSLSSISVSTTISSTNATGANTVVAGNKVTLVITSPSSLNNLQAGIKITRT